MKIIGICFIILGLIECLISKISCSSLCRNCNSVDLKPCFFLFIFAGILLIISGFSLYLTKYKKFPKIKIKNEKRS